MLFPPEAVGGQGWPVVDVPGVAEFPWPFPEVAGEFELLEDPAFGVEPLPGKVPHGDPLGVVPGAFDVFGFTVDGRVLLPGVAGFVEFDPGTVDGAVCGFTEPVCGLAEPVAGAVLGAGVELGACACPVDPPGAAPPDPRLCAITHVAQKKSTERIVSFLADISEASRINFLNGSFRVYI